MADMYSPEKRSDIMSRIRSKETQAEKTVFRYLRQHQIYFQKHYTRAPGKPDIALPRKKLAVFVDGDFWHGRTFDKVVRNHAPDSYWVTKITRNMERDKQQRASLEAAGWKVLTVWDSDINRKRTQPDVLMTIASFLTS